MSIKFSIHFQATLLHKYEIICLIFLSQQDLIRLQLLCLERIHKIMELFIGKIFEILNSFRNSLQKSFEIILILVGGLFEVTLVPWMRVHLLWPFRCMQFDMTKCPNPV